MQLNHNFKIRIIEKEDEIKARKIIFSILKEYGLFDPKSNMDDDLHNICDFYKNDYFGVVAYKGKVVGTYAILGLTEDLAEIRKMYLLKKHRGKGIGSFIIKHLLEYAKERGFSKVRLETASVLKEAIGLYQKLGFSEIDASKKAPRCDRQFELSLKDGNNLEFMNSISNNG